jgi:hypothetical protein
MEAVAGAGTLIQAIGTLQGGSAEEEAAKRNAAQSSRNAAEIRRQAEEDERAYKIMAQRQLGDIRSGYAAGGVALEGSALDVLQESAATSERNALNIKREGEARARAFEDEAEGFSQAGRSAKTASYYGAAGALLGGAAGIMKRV